MKPQQSLFDPWIQVYSDGAHVTHELLRGFFGGNVERALPAPARGVDKMSAHAALPGACGSGNQNAAAAIVSFSTQHGVETGDTARNPSVANLMIQPERRDGKNRDTPGID